MSDWIACVEPERGPDSDVLWHWGCNACAIKAQASVIRYPDDPVMRLILRNVAASVKGVDK